jgi:uncharacterized protein (TIGR02246 family)
MKGLLMRRIVKRFVVVLAATSAIGFGCAKQTSSPDSSAWATVDTDAMAKALAQLDDDWSDAAATKDAERVASFYADDAIAYPPNEPVAIGRAAAKRVWAAYFADKTFSISWKTDRAEVSKNGDIGFTAGSYQASYAGPDGNLVNEKGKYLCTWKRQKDGRWKATHDMWNADAR